MAILKSKLKSTLRSTLKTRNKYGNIPTNGFDSKAEYLRWCTLKELESNGSICNLQHHVPFKFPDGKLYEADFVYWKNNKQIIEDVKNPMLLHGQKFIANRMKMKLYYGLEVQALHPKTHLPY